MASSVRELVRVQPTHMVLIVENDRDVSGYFHAELVREGVPTETALSIPDARRHVRMQLEQKVSHLVILLDLMFERGDPSEGLTFLGELNRLSEFVDDRISVIVFSGATDQKTRETVISCGARQFYAKGSNPSPVLQELLAYTGKQVRVASGLLEIVDIDFVKGEMDVRYRMHDDAAVRCTLDLQLAPKEARVPGGSFWFDTYKRYEDGTMKYENSGRRVDEEADMKVLDEILGEEE